jgi:hypothetical protein
MDSTALILLLVVVAVVAIGGFLLLRGRGKKQDIGTTTLSGVQSPVKTPGKAQAPVSQAEFIDGQDMATLEIVQGPEAVVHGEKQGTHIGINQKKITIGRNPRQVDVQLYNLDQPSSVSRLHCTIEFYPTIQCFMITDEGSSSGTKVDGQTITPYQPHSLKNGDVIELGIPDKLGATLRFHTAFNPPDSGGRLRVDAGIHAKDTIRQAIDAPPVRAQTQPLKSDVFISYSRKDKEAMHVIRDSLMRHNLAVWSDDKLEPGTPSWRNDVQSAIENTKCVVAILSPDAKTSEWVNEELSYAKLRKARVFTVLVRGDESNAIPFGMSGVQWIDMRTDFAEGVQEIVYETATQQLATSIQEYLGRG